MRHADTIVDASRAEANQMARNVQNSLRSIYENLRTLTLLPSVRHPPRPQIDRHATNLTPDSLETIQQVYNNLASNVSVSEVYIVPADLDPERIDPVTGNPEEPIRMFDELIVHAGRYAALPDPFAAAKGKVSASADELPEEEIYEYRQLRDQFAWLRPRFPDSSTIDGLNVPMISGPEVITCDNRVFNHTKADKDRSGMLFSVPFFGPDEKLKGSVTAISF